MNTSRFARLFLSWGLVALLAAGAAANAFETGVSPQAQTSLPFNGDLGANVDFLFSLKENIDREALAAHVGLLFEKLQASQDPETRRRWIDGILDRMADGARPSPEVKSLFLHKIIVNGLAETGSHSTIQIGKALELLGRQPVARIAPSILQTLIRDIDENAIFNLGSQPYQDYCEFAARTYRTIGKPELARYWDAKARYVLTRGADRMPGTPIEVTEKGGHGFFFLIFLASGLLFYLWLIMTRTVQVKDSGLAMAVMLPRWSRKYAILAWAIICQLAFSLYTIGLRLISGDYEGIYFPLALNVATQLFIWGYFKFYIDFGSLSEHLNDLYVLEQDWSQKKLDRLHARGLPLVLGCLWGLAVASAVTFVLPASGWPLRVVFWLYLFFVNFWTGIVVYEIAVISLAILSLQRFPFRNLIGNQAAVFSIGSMVLKISVVLTLYISLCLGSFKLSGFMGIEVYFALYLGFSIIGVVAFFFGVPFFIHSKLKRYRDHQLAVLGKNLGRKLGEIIHAENGNIDDAVMVNSKFRSIMEEIEEIPVWPFNFRIISSFFSVIIIPMIMIIFNLITSSDSILYHMDAFKKLLSLFK